MKKTIFALFILIIFLCSCSGQKPAPVQEKAQDQAVQEPSDNNQVLINNFAFAPKELTIDKGTVVTWKNDDSASHTVVSQGLFTSKTLGKGEEFIFKFDKPGEYDYICSIHPLMKGKIIVK